MNADFESKLQRQPLRELPRDWRAEILAAASVPRPSGLRPVHPSFGGVGSPGQGISTWPSLRAWAALAAVWVVIFLLHVAAPDEPRLARNSPAMTLQSFARLHEQTLMMAQFPGQSEAGEPPVALPALPKPRSEMPRKQLIG
ncbi:MAG: hypothetical protein ABSG78_10410 [Verrucomicrobiota bacterium]|jgi:hypothetical protein